MVHTNTYMEYKLLTSIWLLIGISEVIPALQVTSLCLAILVSIFTLTVLYPKVVERIKQIFKQSKNEDL